MKYDVSEINDEISDINDEVEYLNGVTTVKTSAGRTLKLADVVIGEKYKVTLTDSNADVDNIDVYINENGTARNVGKFTSAGSSIDFEAAYNGELSCFQNASQYIYTVECIKKGFVSELGEHLEQLQEYTEDFYDEYKDYVGTEKQLSATSLRQLNAGSVSLGDILFVKLVDSNASSNYIQVFTANSGGTILKTYLHLTHVSEEAELKITENGNLLFYQDSSPQGYTIRIKKSGELGKYENDNSFDIAVGDINTSCIKSTSEGCVAYQSVSVKPLKHQSIRMVAMDHDDINESDYIGTRKNLQQVRQQCHFQLHLESFCFSERQG